MDIEKFAEQLAEFGRMGREGKVKLQDYLQKQDPDSELITNVNEALEWLDEVSAF